jgi:hypothetical protein
VKLWATTRQDASCIQLPCFVQLIPQNFPPFQLVICQAWQNFSSEDGYGPWQNAPAGKSLPKAARDDTPGAGESLAEALEASHLWGSSMGKFNPYSLRIARVIWLVSKVFTLDILGSYLE